MPIPRTTCSVCKTEVNKAQTYHIGEGKRACKIHEGVGEQAKTVQAKIKEKEKVQNEPRNFRYNPELDVAKAELWAAHTCWTCNKKGVDARSMYLEMLIAMERLKIKGEKFDFFNLSEQIKKEMNWPADLVPLRRFNLPAQAERILHDCGKQRQVVELVGIVQLCPHCANVHGIDFTEPLPSLDTLATMGAIYEETLQPELEKIAKETV
jgi:hypothetical protein